MHCMCHGVVRSFFSFLNCKALEDQSLSNSLYSGTVYRHTKASVPPDNSVMDVPYMAKLLRGKIFAVGMQMTILENFRGCTITHVACCMKPIE